MSMTARQELLGLIEGEIKALRLVQAQIEAAERLPTPALRAAWRKLNKARGRLQVLCQMSGDLDRREDA
jgi:hypothetical protein